MFFYMHKLLPIYNQTYSTVSWGSLAAILLSHFCNFSSISQNMHDIWPFILRLCLPLTFLHISRTL